MTKNILIVDDVEIDINYLKRLLENKYNILCATNGEDSIKMTKENKIDLILLDIIMPKMNGYEVCELLKRDDFTKEIPVVFVTSKIDEKSIVKGYECGAVDYVTKPYKQKELIAKIDTHLRLRSLIDELKYMATHDTMTGILNRREFFRLANKRFNKREKNLYAIMMDLDNFKSINDTYGHQIGDKVIKQFTKIIQNHINKDAIFGRVGGEEFALICNSKKNIQKIEMMREAVENSCVFISNQKIVFTVSIGISNISDNDTSIDDLLRVADDNLYEAKNNGKNRVVFRER